MTRWVGDGDWQEHATGRTSETTSGRRSWDLAVGVGLGGVAIVWKPAVGAVVFVEDGGGDRVVVELGGDWIAGGAGGEVVLAGGVCEGFGVDRRLVEFGTEVDEI